MEANTKKSRPEGNETQRKTEILRRAADKFEREGQPALSLVFKNEAYAAQQERVEFVEIAKQALVLHTAAVIKNSL